MNKVNKLRKHFIRTDLLCPALGLGMSAMGSAKPTYRWLMVRANQCGLFTTRYMPIKQPGEIGPKPMMAKTAKTARHLIWVRFMAGRWLIVVVAQSSSFADGLPKSGIDTNILINRTLEPLIPCVGR